MCRWAAARPVSDVACCLWPHGCSGCRRVRPPARSPHASLRLGVVDLEAWPSSAAAHRHLGPAPRATRASRFPPCVNLRLGVVDLEARPSPPDPPAPSTPAVPGVLVGDRRRFEARPGPAPAHRHPPAPRPGSAGLAVPSTKGGAWCAGGVIGVVLKPGYALPPPTGTAMGTSRRLYACVGFQSGLLGGAALGAGWRRVVGVSRL